MCLFAELGRGWKGCAGLLEALGVRDGRGPFSSVGDRPGMLLKFQTREADFGALLVESIVTFQHLGANILPGEDVRASVSVLA